MIFEEGKQIPGKTHTTVKAPKPNFRDTLLLTPSTKIPLTKGLADFHLLKVLLDNTFGRGGKHINSGSS